MKCEICNANDATMHFQQSINGVTREMHVCENCAKKHGFEVQSPLTMTDFLFGATGEERQDAKAEDLVCSVCGMRTADFKQSSSLGCAACYETFADDLAPLFAEMHKGDHHVGKVPVAEQLTKELSTLQLSLDSAVALQDFEGAALLRDRITDLRSAAVKK